MKYLSGIILTAFTALALFGFAGMLSSYDMEHAANTCLASLAQNGACPPEENTVASAIFHTGAFKVFSTMTLSLGVLLLALAFLSASATFWARAIQDDGMTLAERISFVISRYLGIARLRTALARFELSPSLS